MAYTKEKKKSLIDDFKLHPTDTGSPAVQIALLTERINYLSNHFAVHGKDLHSRHGLLLIVSKRRGHLNYLKKHDPERYKTVIKKLGIRK